MQTSLALLAATLASTIADAGGNVVDDVDDVVVLVLVVAAAAACNATILCSVRSSNNW